jgi:hypothetical protein
MVVPRCSVHGEMRYRKAGNWWICLGWDGERCCCVAAELVSHFKGHEMVLTPADGAPPSQWGYRTAVVFDQ